MQKEQYCDMESCFMSQNKLKKNVNSVRDSVQWKNNKIYK